MLEAGRYGAQHCLQVADNAWDGRGSLLEIASRARTPQGRGCRAALGYPAISRRTKSSLSPSPTRKQIRHGLRPPVAANSPEGPLTSSASQAGSRNPRDRPAALRSACGDWGSHSPQSRPPRRGSSLDGSYSLPDIVRLDRGVRSYVHRRIECGSRYFLSLTRLKFLTSHSLYRRCASRCGLGATSTVEMFPLKCCLPWTLPGVPWSAVRLSKRETD